ncbi:isoprenyl transferase [Pasteuria penetrans]|uniref:isoprenyl transferase n=1 Tax=Pasteuria penetrans TaxID=86005 RepID=UPI0011EE9255|nr:isoprenyl transferase [Pasteuria penetrans]
MKRWRDRKGDEEDDKRLQEDLRSSPLPTHVAIITDGNGRWARQRGLHRTVGHKAGVQRVQEIVRAAHRLTIPVLTFYVFSTENWRRPADEVDFLLGLPSSLLRSHLSELMGFNVRVRIIGDRTTLPQKTRETIDEFEGSTGGNTGMILNFAVNYGSRDEIVQAVRAIARDAAAGKISPEEVDTSLFEQNLLTQGLPDPDLIIRTSGEMRVSNFLLWQLAYSELLFVDTLWPDFTAQQFHWALWDFQLRSRRYGSVD